MSEASSSEHDRTEPASQFKLNEAKKHGQVAKSLDVNSFFMVSALLAILLLIGGKAWMFIGRFSESVFLNAGDYGRNERSLLESLAVSGNMYWSVLMAPLCIGVVAAIIGNLIQTGFIFSAEPIKPKFERLNPVAGFKRVFTKRLLIEGLKSIFKLAVLLTVGYTTFSGRWQELSQLPVQQPLEQLRWLASIGSALLFRLLLALLVIALLDLALSRWQFAKQMRMSRRDIKDEVKRREGDPLIRSKIRQLQRENLKQSKSLSRVPEADVLITNPTHFAVALKYIRGEMSAPMVTAKGSERWAQDMRALATRHGVPVLERKSLARKLFRHANVGQPVPAETFVDVARLYADVARYRRQRMTNRAEVPA